MLLTVGHQAPVEEMNDVLRADRFDQVTIEASLGGAGAISRLRVADCRDEHREFKPLER